VIFCKRPPCKLLLACCKASCILGSSILCFSFSLTVTRTLSHAQQSPFLPSLQYLLTFGAF
jgi:hypothetical protein